MRRWSSLALVAAQLACPGPLGSRRNIGTSGNLFNNQVHTTSLKTPQMHQASIYPVQLPQVRKRTLQRFNAALGSHSSCLVRVWGSIANWAQHIDQLPKKWCLQIQPGSQFSEVFWPHKGLLTQTTCFTVHAKKSRAGKRDAGREEAESSLSGWRRVIVRKRWQWQFCVIWDFWYSSSLLIALACSVPDRLRPFEKTHNIPVPTRRRSKSFWGWMTKIQPVQPVGHSCSKYKVIQ